MKPPPGTLKLRGWRCPNGSTAGMWLIEDMPGAALCGMKEGWTLGVVSADLKISHRGKQVSVKEMGDRPRWVWGKDYSVREASRIARRNPHLQGFFRTRRELLEAIEMARAGRVEPQLKDLL